MASRFERDKNWADDHSDQIEEILQQFLGKRVAVQPSPLARDVYDGIDYEVSLPTNNVACRVRRVDSCGKLRQLTIGTSARSGGRSEAVKLGAGQVQWYLYG